ncbi:MAG: substrate-binding domain-containing protein [Verrucomicrobiaceae bacterium]|nr:substrate-binding domain-containing protein [Verrucomicrobiaceae bacterium]
MRRIHKLTITEQTAAHVREGIRSGRWRGELPGVLRLAQLCDVSKDSMRGALRMLEAEGMISAGHAGTRRIVLGKGVAAGNRPLRVAIFPHDPLMIESREMHDLLHDVRRELLAAGHSAEFTPKTQSELHHDLRRIAKLVAGTPADAWIVGPAPRETLEFFAAQSVPVITIGGRCMEVTIASVYTDTAPAYREVLRQLFAFGHHRIVLLCPRSWRQPAPGVTLKACLEELAAHEIAATEFNVPDYEPTALGLNSLLESLFSVTPPTALIVVNPEEATAVYVFLARHGLAVPRDVSLFFPWRDVSMRLCHPPVAHLLVDGRLHVRRIVRWASAVARGRPDRSAIGIPATLELGQSLGPRPQTRSKRSRQVP